MNVTLSSRYARRTHRLALGIEPVDAARGFRVPPPLYVLRDDIAFGDAELRRLRDGRYDVTDALPRLDRHPTCRYVLRYGPGVFRPATPRVDLRLVEGPARSAPRRFVPRRLRIPLVDADDADAREPGFRIRRPGLFPGAAYPLHESATAVRGRAVRDGEPERWVRVVAVRAGTETVVGRAHGDDRGEFLLVLDPAARAPADDEDPPVRVEVRVFAPAARPDPPSPLRAAVDPHWDLPLEELPDTADPEPVVRGHEHPAGYAQRDAREITVPPGAIHSERTPFEVAD